jgi:hypothetical protein
MLFLVLTNTYISDWDAAVEKLTLTEGFTLMSPLLTLLNLLKYMQALLEF